eukprot:Sspe_Gene.20010::Locus_7312_Transcript_1_1_Confidence_1.000_Length_13148::g.20010::m.20010/K10408/DNAH; dynein heavy chain, axonemal
MAEEMTEPLSPLIGRQQRTDSTILESLPTPPKGFSFNKAVESPVRRAGSEFLEDTQVAWILDRASTALAGTPNLGGNAIASSTAQQQLIKKFFGGGHSLIVAKLAGADELVVMEAFTEQEKYDGAVIFWRSSTVELHLDNMQREVRFMRLDGDQIESLANLLEGIFIPLLKSGKAMRWPKMTQQETVRDIQTFSQSLSYFKGQMQGMTILPMPAEVAAPPAEASHEQRERYQRAIHNLETTMVEWARQIRAAVQADPKKRYEEAEAAGVFLGPMVELEFWKKKKENLRNLVLQLSGTPIRVVQVLTKSNSTYVKGFDDLMSELDDSLVAAGDIHVHLETLRPYLSQLEGMSILDIPSNLTPIFHLLTLIWYTSHHFTTSRLIVLMRLLGNSVVSAAQRHLAETDLLAGNFSPEILAKLREARDGVSALKETFFSYRTQVNVQYRQRPWHLEDSAVFARVDHLLNRLHDLLEIGETRRVYMQLDSLVLGGNNGKQDGIAISQVLQEFILAYEAFKSQSLPSWLDPDPSTQFEPAYEEFTSRINAMDRRLAKAVCRAFDDTHTIAEMLDMLECIRCVHWRGQVKVEAENRVQEVLSATHREYDSIKLQFINEKAMWGSFVDVGQHPVPRSLPMVTEMLYWSNGLIERVRRPYQGLLSFDKTVFAALEGQQVKAKHDQILSALSAWQEDRMTDWRQCITTLCLDKLESSLLRRRGGSGKLMVNFDRDLALGLEAIRNVLALGVEVGEQVMKVFSQRNEYRIHIARLEVVATQYNHIIDTIVEVERPLIAKQLSTIHVILNEGLSELTWRSPRISDFVSRASKAVSHLHGNLVYIKGNVAVISRILKGWKDMWKVIHFNEKESLEHRKKSILNELTSVWQGEAVSGLSEQERIGKKWLKRWRNIISTQLRSIDDVLRQNRRIHKLVEYSRDLLHIDSVSPAWVAYVNSINNMFKVGFVAAVRKSLEHLLEFLEPVRNLDSFGRPQDKTQSTFRMIGHKQARLMEVQLFLADGSACFEPTTNRDAFGSVQYRVYEWCNTIFEVARQLQRLDDPENSYYGLVFDNPELTLVKDEIFRLMHTTVERMHAVRMEYLKYSQFWTMDIGEYLSSFVAGRLAFDDKERTEKEAFASDDEDPGSNTGDDGEELYKDEGAEEKPKAPRRVPPTLQEFEAQINKFAVITKEVQDLPATVDYGWLLLSTERLKDELIALTREWRNRFLEYLRDRVARRLRRFELFVQDIGKGVEGCEHGYEDLTRVMEHLARFQSTCDAIDRMFDPLKETVNLLKKFEMSLPATFLEQLDQAPGKWRDLKTLCFQANELLTPRQLEEVGRIAAWESNLEQRAAHFHATRFQKRAPLSIDIHPRQAFKSISELHLMVAQFEHQLRELRQRQVLFQLMQCPGKAVMECRNDLRLLKQLWDAIALTSYQLDTWNRIPFHRVDFEDIEGKVRHLMTILRGLDRRVRGWPAYSGIETCVKNLLMVLPLMQSLRNPAMRPVHWEELMDITKVRFRLSETLTVQHLLALNLHNYVDQVGVVVGKAMKQGQIEQQLAELQTTWASLSLTFTYPPGSDTPIFTIPDNVQRIIGEHQLVLQNLAENRFVADHLAEIQKWQQTIATIENVLSLFDDVQHTWRYLQSIFIGSDDLREHLPKDTQLFAELDKSLKELLKEAAATPLIVSLCMKEGQEEHLSSFQSQLARCERALEVFIAQKRLLFPRFFFVSLLHLLEILSKAGRDPRLVVEHIPRIVQEVAALRFTEGTSNAIGVYGKGDEYFALKQPVSCTGPRVEEWLEKIVTAIGRTILSDIEHAVHTYTERPLVAWLEGYMCQVVLVALSIHFTIDVASAFHAMDEGNEGALREQKRRCVDQLTMLIGLVDKDMAAAPRRKIMNLVTHDVHACDVVSMLIEKKVESRSSFPWQRQLRPFWDEKLQGVRIELCDSHFEYGGEYIGNSLRLIVTPLTERIFITLTQSLHLRMGGAPTGPAGTGKTETVKDLACQLGKACYVFNCSEQMSIQNLSNTFKGVAASGLWACFDEFNRIKLPVLSVVASHFKCILDAIRENRKVFQFDRDDITLDPSLGVFITMNPGYKGRTELPDNLKVLFRPVTVACPDNAMICENLLLAEGFQAARHLAKKVIALFELCCNLISRENHYDWGLRSIKSLLSVAGSLKRALPKNTSEEMVLMRALREFNLPKITPSDLDTFLELIQDLFPTLTMPDPDRGDAELDAAMRNHCTQAGYQAEEGLLAKCLQLRSLLNVRHCGFILGPPAAGKTVCWKTLVHSIGDSVYHVLNPKAVSVGDLFGYVDQKSKEWMDGVAAHLIRHLASAEFRHPSSDKLTTASLPSHRWIIFDGDLDTEWIESMNSVMDDNKVLTIASNDRIPILDSMRLLFEITSLQHATPATVSRAGMLYVSLSDIGWSPYLQTFFDQLGLSATVTPLVDKYVQRCLDWVAMEGKTVGPISEFTMVQQLCSIIGALVTTDRGVPYTEREVELLFVFACIWAFGGALSCGEVVDYRAKFDRWWRTEWKGMKFPEGGTVFDYCISSDAKKMERWADRFGHWQPELDSEVPLSQNLVPTPTTQALQYFIDLLYRRKPILVLGNSGVGKTALARSRLRTLPDDIGYYEICFSYLMDSQTLQRRISRRLERKMGRKWGPTGKKAMVLLLDDLNTPMVDKYGTQSAIALLRQLFDYGMWYRRAPKWVCTEVCDLYYVAAMNPTLGSYTVNPRFQRHFIHLHLPPYPRETLQHVFGSILRSYMQESFSRDIAKLADKLVVATLDLHEGAAKIPKRDIKILQEISMRQLSQVVQGIMLAPPSAITSAEKLLRLWVHECQRTYSDRLPNETDSKSFDVMLERIAGSHFGTDYDTDTLLYPRPLFIPTSETSVGERDYDERYTVDTLCEILTASLKDYNEVNTAMDLVIFRHAAEHVARICRVVVQPCSHAMLVGVGGSGKQSLARLAAYASDLVLPIISSMDIGGFRECFKGICTRSGIKNENTMLLLPETAVTCDRILVDVCDFMHNGDIPEVFSNEDKDDIIRKVRVEVRTAMIIDSMENCWRFFTEKVRNKVHVVMCFSPGEPLRVRLRRFPALALNAVVDWFHSWPTDALITVGRRMLADLELGVDVTSAERVKRGIVEFLATTHREVAAAAESFANETGRRVYITPKMYLEALHSFGTLLTDTLAQLDAKRSRLEAGLQMLRKAAHDTVSLQDVLGKKQQVVAEKKVQVDELLAQLEKETKLVEQEKAKAAAEEQKALECQRLVANKARECEEDLAKAEPLLQSAQKALRTLNKANLTELKSFKNPPPEVQNVMACVIILLSPSSAPARDRSWAAAHKLMKSVDVFLHTLNNFRKDLIPESHIAQIRPYLKNPDFRSDVIRTKSFAAAGICDWVVNIHAYYQIHLYVQPKREQVAEERQRLEEVTMRVNRIKGQVEKLLAKHNELENAVLNAQAERDVVERQTDEMAERLELSQRLVKSLGIEQGRWTDAVADLAATRQVKAGDVLLAACLVSYAGPFDYRYRQKVVEEQWVPRLKASGIPHSTSGLNPVSTLATPAQIAEWANQNLPRDSVSIQNACICSNVHRTIILIDPQFQGLAWIRKWLTSGDDESKDSEGEQGSKKERRVRMAETSVPSAQQPLGAKPRRPCLTCRSGTDMLKTVIKGIQTGSVVIVEHITEEIDPALVAIMKRETLRSDGKEKLILGDREVEWNPSFQLILHTKLHNPQYSPEVQAEASLVNFSLTPEGLEDQLLSLVINKERAELESRRQKLLYEINQYTINIASLEDGIIMKFSQAGDDLLERSFVEKLESMMNTTVEFSSKAAEAERNEEQIEAARGVYREVARRGSTLFFLLTRLQSLEWLYQFSLHSFALVFYRTLATVHLPRKSVAFDSGFISETHQKQYEAELIQNRVKAMIDAVTLATFQYVQRGMFNRHKLVFAMLLCLSAEISKGNLAPDQLDGFLGVRSSLGPAKTQAPPGSWITQKQWESILELSNIQPFGSLPSDIESRLKRWKDWSDLERPEVERLPGEWRSIDEFSHLLLVKALRPDRLSSACRNFITQKMGAAYLEQHSSPALGEVLKEAVPGTYILFLLFLGADPLKEVELVGKRLGMTVQSGSLRVIAMGEGQGEVALEVLQKAAENGGWVMLQNIHLMGSKWLHQLEVTLETLGKNTHKEFRVMFSTEPSDDPDKQLPPGIIQSSIKLLSNEPVLDLKTNFMRAWTCFSPEQFEAHAKVNEYKTLMFALAFFHATVVARKRFPHQGWSQPYAFNLGDLAISSQVLHNYLDVNSHSVPWDDIRYILGDIMYGGHITDEWDRRTCRVYLDELLNDDLFIKGELAPGLICPLPTTYQQYAHFIEAK